MRMKPFPVPVLAEPRPDKQPRHGEARESNTEQGTTGSKPLDSRGGENNLSDSTDGHKPAESVNALRSGGRTDAPNPDRGSCAPLAQKT
jgi:hypothetical protein